LYPQTKSPKCIACGKNVPKDGYKISWDIQDLSLEEPEDERYFCCINCVKRWIENLGKTGLELNTYMDAPTLSQINRDTTHT
jgi:hypothetical protein